MNQKIRLAFVFASLIGLAACSSVKLDDQAGGAPIDNRGGAAGGGPGTGGSTGATAGGTGRGGGAVHSSACTATGG